MKGKTIKDIKSLFQQADTGLDEDTLHSIKTDPRKGVQQLWKQWQQRKELERTIHNKYLTRSTFENQCYPRGYTRIAGVDEVGRGPLAGPVVAGAVILDVKKPIYGLDDSKRLSERRRAELYEEIMDKAIAVGIGKVSSEEIDRINIYQASKIAMISAIDALPVRPDYLLVDAMTLPINFPQEGIVKGDGKSNSIAAASIIAKVTRDRLMVQYDQAFPAYSFRTNMGYATSQHLAAIESHGITPIHRRSFARVVVNEQAKETVNKVNASAE